MEKKPLKIILVGDLYWQLIVVSSRLWYYFIQLFYLIIIIIKSHSDYYLYKFGYY